jgi:P pilus assembly chaperone PapD
MTASPVHLSITDKNKSTSISIANSLDTPITVDVRVKKWDAGNTLTETDVVVLSRPVVTVPANSTVTVRAIVKSRSSAAEDTYRVFVTDITPHAKGESVGVKLSFSLPLFILNTTTSKGVLTLDSGAFKNTGNRHVRISSFKNIKGAQVDEMHYLMPGESIKLSAISVSDIVYTDDVF